MTPPNPNAPAPKWPESRIAEVLARCDKARSLIQQANAASIGGSYDLGLELGILALTDLPAAVEEIGRLRDALKQIAKPALGGKQQQWIAQRALDAAKEPK